MASLRLTFPEKDQPTVIALTGARLTIGRLPFNTIQIIDRTVSGFHAELISEHGHYRLHDRGSSNGTFVNGQKVSDYHLNEGCTISFGTVEAQFNPEDVAAVEEAETFPSRGEVNSVRQENAEMRATVSALREEISALRQEHKASAEGAGATVSREEYEQVVVEREALKEIQLRHEEEINRFKTDLAILKRDRLNLQLAYDGAQREMEQLRRKVSGEKEELALPPVEAAAVLAAQADEVRIELPKSPTLITPAFVPGAAPAAPVEDAEVAQPQVTEGTGTPIETPEAPEPLAPAASLPFKPLPRPMVPPAKAPVAPSAPTIPVQTPKPSAPAGLPQKPAGLPPRSSALPPGAIIKPPGAVNSNGIRPLPPATGAKPGGPAPAVTPRVGQRPQPVARPVAAQPTVKVVPVPPPKSGPKGTQKLTE